MMNPGIFKAIDLGDRNIAVRKLGMGAIPGQMSPTVRGETSQTPTERFVGAIQVAARAPNWTLPTIESVRIHYDGPLSDAAVQQGFGAFIDPLGSNQNSPPLGASSVESTLAEPGKFQTNVLILAIGWHLEPVPQVWTAKGNAFSVAGVPPSTATASPVSPDDFVAADLVAAGPLGVASGMVPAYMDFGGWQELAFYYMSRAYDLEWQMGNRTYLLRDSLRFTAYTPTSGQEGASSSSEVDVYPSVRDMNNYYRNLPGCTSIFLPADRTRIGNMTLIPTGGATTAGLSVFRPTRAYETVGATYGGMGLRNALKGNQEFRRLTSPFLMRPGVPIGLKCHVSNTDDQVRMQSWLAASFLGLGGGGAYGTPAVFSSDAFINAGQDTGGAGAGGATGMEPSLDSTVTPEGVQALAQRAAFKAGPWKLACVLKGFELTDAQADFLRQPGVAAAVQSSCGCMGSALSG